MQEIEQESKYVLNLKKPWILTSWSVLLLLVGFIFYSQAQPAAQPESESLEDPAGLLIMQLQTQYLLGVSSLTGDQSVLATQAQMLDMGTIDQRQRFMALMIAIGEIESAKKSSLKLQEALEASDSKFDESQAAAQKFLNILMAGNELPIDNNLEEQLGWFGDLLFATPHEMEEIGERESFKVLVIAFTLLFLLCFGLIGFVILIVCAIRAMNGDMDSGMGKPMLRHGFYVEVFILWLIAFLVLMSASYLISNSDVGKTYPLFGTVSTLTAFFGSLSVLLWARFRGIGWQQIKEDIGWNCGKGLWNELAWGVVGYGVTLPILCCGLLLTIVLMAVQTMMLGGPDDNLLHGTGGGSHPIIVEIANGGWALRVGLICLAAIAAPVVEETMFRGVLYRQLRSSMLRFGSFIGVCLSIGIVSFIFAAIHPQGWVAIPVLMSIAIGMNLLREQRGSIIAPMVIHGINNGLVTALMIYFVSQ